MSKPYSVNGLSHIGIIVSDIERSIAFYRDNLFFTVDKRVEMDNGMKLAFISAGTCLVELVQKADKTTTNIPGTVDHVCVDVTGIDQLVEDLRAKGVIFMADKVSDLSGGLSGYRNIFLTGPDGEKLEFFEKAA
jgi:lactoylglutathione lyase